MGNYSEICVMFDELRFEFLSNPLSESHASTTGTSHIIGTNDSTNQFNSSPSLPLTTGNELKNVK